jgi:hypothetical protein
MLGRNWLDYDVVALTVLVFGVGAFYLVAFFS